MFPRGTVPNERENFTDLETTEKKPRYASVAGFYQSGDTQNRPLLSKLALLGFSG